MAVLFRLYICLAKGKPGVEAEVESALRSPLLVFRFEFMKASDVIGWPGSYSTEGIGWILAGWVLNEIDLPRRRQRLLVCRDRVTRLIRNCSRRQG